MMVAWIFLEFISFEIIIYVLSGVELGFGPGGHSFKRRKVHPSAKVSWCLDAKCNTRNVPNVKRNVKKV